MNEGTREYTHVDINVDLCDSLFFGWGEGVRATMTPHNLPHINCGAVVRAGNNPIREWVCRLLNVTTTAAITMS